MDETAISGDPRAEREYIKAGQRARQLRTLFGSSGKKGRLDTAKDGMGHNVGYAIAEAIVIKALREVLL